MVPIHDAQGRVIGFGARLLDDGEDEEEEEKEEEKEEDSGRGQVMLRTRAGEDPEGEAEEAVEWEVSGEVSEAEAKAKKPYRPKYLNSPETVLFRKKEVFFGLHRARPAARAEGSVVVVEGYFDVLQLHAAGICNGAVGGERGQRSGLPAVEGRKVWKKRFFGAGGGEDNVVAAPSLALMLCPALFFFPSHSLAPCH